ncbi:pyridoxine 4-dehydrogenase [Talaromyces islandicus]|uniref:Pyridoxine 4-dehydrogenase n=1 Tax=Talaromyces islandicus TaxID=28573 RepID=A0A0U1M1P7_TALIS|nr:pyridoxine 4-dehydrogenase [Talaromyces islandicus]
MSATTIVNKNVGSIGFGLMGLTTRPKKTSYDDAVKVMKRALDLGANFWNAGEFYGPPDANSLQLLEYYFRKYPEDSGKVVLSIKGCFSLAGGPDNSPESVRKSIDNCLDKLQGRVPISIFEPARIDPKVPIEETIKVFAEYVKKGKIGGIGLSECSAATIRRAHAVYPISAVEIEMSLFTTDALENGVAATCAELGIPIVAYSPLGWGFLTGQFKSLSDLDENDFRRHQPRFQPGAFEANLRIAEEVQKISASKGVTPAQTAIAWVKAQGQTSHMPQIVPIPGCTTVARVEENLQNVTLSESELEDLNGLLQRTTVQGDRYGGAMASLMHG